MPRTPEYVTKSDFKKFVKEYTKNLKTILRVGDKLDKLLTKTKPAKQGRKKKIETDSD